MTRTAIESALIHTAIVGVAGSLLLLAGCATAPVESVAPHPELIGWSLMNGGYACPIYDQGVGVLCGVHRFGDEDDAFDTVGVTVDAFSEGE